MSLFKRLTKWNQPGSDPFADGEVDEIEVEPGATPDGQEQVVFEAMPDDPEIVITLPDACSLNELLVVLVEQGGSDLHLSVGASPAFRIHGTLHFSKAPALTEEVARALLLGLIPEEQVEKFAVSGNHDFAYAIDGLARFRCNLFRQNHGMGAVFRIIPSKIQRLDELNLPGVLRKIALTKSGLIVVTGPTGSGKSTTLAAMVDLINRERQCHIITIEDPIEFVHTSHQSIVDHREVGHHASSFADALRAALREDPDILLVGEMRDLETVYNAVKAAETGAVVFGTLHTNNAAKTVERIVDVFPAPQQPQIRAMLSESLQAVVAQLLLKKLGGGRVAVNEILLADAGFSNLIREGKTQLIPNFISMGQALGMQTMDMGLLDLLRRKVIHPQIVAEHTNDFAFFKGAGFDLEKLRVG